MAAVAILSGARPQRRQRAVSAIRDGPRPFCALAHPCSEKRPLSAREGGLGLVPRHGRPAAEASIATDLDPRARHDLGAISRPRSVCSSVDCMRHSSCRAVGDSRDVLASECRRTRAYPAVDRVISRSMLPSDSTVASTNTHLSLLLSASLHAHCNSSPLSSPINR
jgi:hypothetical protein